MTTDKTYPRRTKQQNKVNMCYADSMDELWRNIEGFDKYEVSSLGNVRSKQRLVNWSHHGKSGLAKKSQKIIKPVPRQMSKYITYMQVNLYRNDGKSISVHIHRLVAKAFIEKPMDKTQVNHIDGNGTNNNISNLEWVTSSENSLHAYRILGRKAWHKGNKGSNTPTSKPILQLDREGNLIKRWDCGLDAVREGGFNSGGISRTVNGINKTHKGYRWKYAT